MAVFFRERNWKAQVLWQKQEPRLIDTFRCFYFFPPSKGENSVRSSFFSPCFSAEKKLKFSSKSCEIETGSDEGSLSHCVELVGVSGAEATICVAGKRTLCAFAPEFFPHFF